MSFERILVVDPDEGRAKHLEALLEFTDHEATVIDAGKDYTEVLTDLEDLMVILLGCRADPLEQAALLKDIHQRAPMVPIIIVHNRGSQPTHCQASGKEVLSILEIPTKYSMFVSALHKAQLYRESHTAERQKRPVDLFRSLAGSSRAIKRVRRLIEQVADSDANVLILGESGTGKEVVARNIHYHSSRRNMPFVPINCGAIPPDLLESELFGHEKGAFTGAISSRQGRFEMAHGGTLFLDEIGDMPLNMQVKLLRVLQERHFERVGGNKVIHVDVRIIAATHRNLEEAIQEERFREDLYYRLNVFPIDMPPLRERVEDVPVLINDLISRIEHEKRGSVRLTPGAIMCLCQYPWPGNVRELANLIERLAILYPYEVVNVAELPEKFQIAGASRPTEAAEPTADESLDVGVIHMFDMPRLPREGMDLKAHISKLECAIIKQALEESHGIVAHAARRLKMRRTTLVEKLRKYGLQRSDDTTGI